MAGCSGLMIAPDACDWMCVFVLKIKWDELTHGEVWRRAVSVTEESWGGRINVETVKQAARGLLRDGRAIDGAAILVHTGYVSFVMRCASSLSLRLR